MTTIPQSKGASPTNRRRRFLATLALGAAFAAAVAGPAHAVVEKPKLVLAVGGKATLYYLPLTLAERLGYFRDEGLDVEINDFPGGAKALQALIGGSADVVSGAYEHTIRMQARGQMGPQDTYVATSLIGSEFTGRIAGPVAPDLPAHP